MRFLLTLVILMVGAIGQIQAETTTQRQIPIYDASDLDKMWEHYFYLEDLRVAIAEGQRTIPDLLNRVIIVTSAL